MSQWVFKGVATGIKTTRYPAREETAPGVSPGLAVSGEFDAASGKALMDCCPTKVFSMVNGRIEADVRRCVHCFRCLRAVKQPANWEHTYEWAIARQGENEFISAFHKSIHICVVDAGDCGACINEVRQLNNPYYNMHRLGFFITPTPRHADVLLVVGPVTDHMREPLQKAYDAMPTPKRVVAVGACALSGSVFGPSFVSSAGLRELMHVDVEVPGQPPPPLAILHGLLVAVGRKVPAALFTDEFAESKTVKR
jgi:Ni,Fe-hydrogenase III small subunit/ferredoxin-like protein FixX